VKKLHKTTVAAIEDAVRMLGELKVTLQGEYDALDAFMGARSDRWYASDAATPYMEWRDFIDEAISSAEAFQDLIDTLPKNVGEVSP
jgi:hypothetical protein